MYAIIYFTLLRECCHIHSIARPPKSQKGGATAAPAGFRPGAAGDEGERL